MKLTEILSCLPIYQGPSDIEFVSIASVEVDSREVKHGSLFVCIKGFTVDGHTFAEKAVANGAVAIIAEKAMKSSVPVIVVPDTSRALARIAVTYYDYPTNELPLIGVTGTNGKTTVTYLLEKIFNQHQQKTGLIGTIQMKIGALSFPINNTTPNALVLQQAFKQMVDQGVNQAIMEVSSHALDEGRTYGCDFDIAIFTNLSQDHLDFHQNMDDYLRAKSLLFAQLGNGYAKHKEKFAVINVDDPASALLMKSTAQNIVTYGVHHHALVMANDVKLGATGTRFNLVTPKGTIVIQSKLIGMFNVYNMLAASAAAIAAHIPLEVIKQALESIAGVNGRFELVTGKQPYSVIVDYAHTPDSLENVLQTIKEFAKQKVFVVVGCGGDRDRTKRPLMANIAVKYADHALFTSDNPRTENPQDILDDMVNGIANTVNNYEVILDRKQAIQHVINLAGEDDVILIAGKGHETYQQIGLHKYDFDDRLVAREAMNIKEN